MGKLWKQKDFNKMARKLQGGDKKAGEEIFNYFSPKIFRYFFVRISNRETAEDLTQEVFMKLIDKISTFNGDLGSFSAWFWQVARNTLTDYYRAQKAIPFSALGYPPEAVFVSNETGCVSPEKEKLEEVLKLVKNFSEEEQEIFSLRYLSDLSYKELASLADKPEGSLRVIVHRINQKIRKMIHD